MKSKSVRICLIVMAAYLILGAFFYPIAGDSLHFTDDITETVSAKATLESMEIGDTVRQSFLCEYDVLKTLTVIPSTMAKQKYDIIEVKLTDDGGNTVYETRFGTDTLHDHEEFIIPIDPDNGGIQNAVGRYFTLHLTSTLGAKGNAITFYYGNSVDTGRIDVPVQIEDTEALYFNGERMTDENGVPCSLCLQIGGRNNHWVGPYYWFLYAGGALLLAMLLVYLLFCHRKGKKNILVGVACSIFKYSFLIRQLVARDFKTKYKRSVLGMFWSFLNPLLTMSIQYVVFSTIFKSTIPNFVIYLLSGIICYNFFNEATGMCLMSIIGNASLINKVYVPKYIYPFSRTLSSGINLLLSLVPLLIMMIVTKTPITSAILLLPFVLLMLFLFSYGVGLILATMMVFFRDTQFLWNIFSMLLMYLTPIFYPDSIIPAKFMTVYKLNPLYHILRFIRSLLIDGVSLEPKAYLYCIILCMVPFLLGVLIFRKNQDKFVLNI